MFMIPGGAIATTPPGGYISPDETDTNKWALTIGNNFGILINGKVYCTDAVISGSIQADKTSSIGGWIIDSDGYWKKSVIFEESGNKYTTSI